MYPSAAARAARNHPQSNLQRCRILQEARAGVGAALSSARAPPCFPLPSPRRCLLAVVAR
eukprot:3820705-Alexandrium_andersonii.AAC.1